MATPAAQAISDADFAGRLRGYLGRAFQAPDLTFKAGPDRIRGGFDASIFGFELEHAPPDLSGPLILRLNSAQADPARTVLESAVQNSLAKMGFPAPKVFATESDPNILGGPFMVMERLAGKPLAHGIESAGSPNSTLGQVRLLSQLPSILRRIRGAWIDVQLRLHALPVEPVLASLVAAGVDTRLTTFEGQLARMRALSERPGLADLQAGIGWLEANKPAGVLPASICHGDFHPLNIMADGDHVTGVIDWANVVIAPREMDVGSAISNIATFPFEVPRLLRPALRGFISLSLWRYRRDYQRRHRLDDDAIKYFQVFRAMAQLLAVRRRLADGEQGGGAFHSEAGMRNLAARIRALSGIVLGTSG